MGGIDLLSSNVIAPIKIGAVGCLTLLGQVCAALGDRSSYFLRFKEQLVLLVLNARRQCLPQKKELKDGDKVKEEQRKLERQVDARTNQIYNDPIAYEQEFDNEDDEGDLDQDSDEDVRVMPTRMPDPLIRGHKSRKRSLVPGPEEKGDSSKQARLDGRGGMRAACRDGSVGDRMDSVARLLGVLFLVATQADIC